MSGIDPILVEGVREQAALETGGDVRRLLQIFFQEGTAAQAVPVISLAGRSVDASRERRGGDVKGRLCGKSKPTNVCALHDSGIEHPAPTSVSGGDSKPNTRRKTRHHAR